MSAAQSTPPTKPRIIRLAIPKSVPTKLQQAIIEWQDREGLTRMMAAHKSGVSYFTLTALMTGTSKRPSAATIQKLVQAGVVIDTEVLKSL